MERVKRSGAGILRFRPPNRLPRPPIFRRYFFFFLFFFHLPSSPPRVSPAVSSCTLEKTERFERIRRMTCDFRVSPQPDRLPTDLSHRSATRSIRRGSIDPSRESKRAWAAIRRGCPTKPRQRINYRARTRNSPLFTLHYLRVYVRRVMPIPGKYTAE